MSMGLIELLILIVIIAWILGALVVPVGTSLIHLLLVLVLVLIAVRLIQGARPLP